MGLILDSSPLVADARGKFDLAGFLATRDEPVAIAAITASELLHGCHRAADDRRRKKRTEYVEWVLSEFAAVPPSRWKKRATMPASGPTGQPRET